MFDVKLTILLMGRTCSSCKQNFSCTVAADNAERAVSEAKKLSGADPELNKFLINYVRAKS